MTTEVLELLISRLTRKLGLDEPESDVLILLEDELCDAEAELLLYLNREELPAAMQSKVVELAALFYRRDITEEPNLKAASYSEGDVSQSETYMTTAEFQTAVTELLSGIAHWRRRAT